MIAEEFYHLSIPGSKTNLYFNQSHKHFLCRMIPYQPWIRIIVALFFYIPSFPVSHNDIMSVVLAHCKYRVEFISYLFRNLPLSLMVF